MSTEPTLFCRGSFYHHKLHTLKTAQIKTTILLTHAQSYKASTMVCISRVASDLKITF